ncbi:MAG: radical SAM protein [Candidatus Falkowbacteria bacterium]
MKILLIYPPSINKIQTPVPEAVNSVVGFYPPLGLLCVAGYVRAHSDFGVKVLDAQVERLDYDGIAEILAKERPDVVGIQTMTHTLVDALKTAEVTKRIDSKCHVCLGGNHVEIYPLETIQLPNVDSAVIGEGEIKFLKLCQALAADKSLEGIPGVIARNNGKIINNGPGIHIDNIDDLNFPARDLVPFKKYQGIMDAGKIITTLISSRGCPNQCAFCSEVGTRFRWRNAKSIADEIEECQSLGINVFFFFDDTFNAYPKHAVDVCQEIINRKLKIEFDVRARVNNINEELLMALKAAGCRRIQFGVESGCQKVLRELKKNITLEQVSQAFAMAKKYRFVTYADFMIGNPGEGREELMQTFAFAKEIDPDYVQYSVFTPYPNTALYRRGIKEGLFGDFWLEYAKNPTNNFMPRLWEEYFTKEELNYWISFAYKDFYLRPKYILKSLFKIESFRDLLNKINAAIKLIFIKGLKNSKK